MKYRKLGNTDITVSAFCIGGMSFGERQPDSPQWTLNEKDTQEIIAHAYDLGINFIDTANQYANGTSESFIGKSLKNLQIPRDRIIIASKVYFNEGHLSKEAIEREIDGSLERLQTDYLDLYQIHRFDYTTPIEETLETLDSLVKKGKVRALGASSMFGYQLHNMLIAMEKHNWTTFSTMQNHYNLLYREDERELIPVCRQYGLSLIPYSPLAGGHLARKQWNTSSERSEKDAIVKRRYDASKEDDLRVVEKVALIAEKYNVSMSAIALAWLFSKGVTAPLIGATKKSHFDAALDALEINLTEEDMECLESCYVPHVLKGPIPEPKPL